MSSFSHVLSESLWTQRTRRTWIIAILSESRITRITRKTRIFDWRCYIGFHVLAAVYLYACIASTVTPVKTTHLPQHHNPRSPRNPCNPRFRRRAGIIRAICDNP
ncbi:MAG: hypothetical protein OXI43_18310 [Candidatus Poribacteria bacterium]|nr:hypothetical protein [Candidatus Poribacteria bacterium]